MQNISGWLNINKPMGPSSMGVLIKLKKILPKQKIGHAGTLDPMAYGVLPIAFNQTTRLIEFCVGLDKTYKFAVQMGASTDTYDAEGKITQECAYIPSEEILIQKCKEFVGTIAQVPPIYSAIKINGQRAYDLARHGKEDLEMSARFITIMDLKLISYSIENKTAEFIVKCSKGTYVRSLAYDIMKACGSLGYVIDLARLAVGEFKLENAINLDELTKIDLFTSQNVIYNSILRPEYVLRQLPYFQEITINISQLRDVWCGKIIELDHQDSDSVWLSHNEQLVSVGSIMNGKFIVKKNFNLN